jgi:iron(III) transport system substrate-binding protein
MGALNVRSLKIGVSALLATAALAACGSSSSSGNGSMTLYNGQHEETTLALVKAFEQQTGIHVNVRSAGEGTLVQQITQEGSSSPADVIYTENSPALERLREANRLAPVNPSTLAATPSQYNSPQGDWVGVSARVTVLVYNTGALKPSQLPSSVMGLADSTWKGKFGYAPTETDLQPVVTSIAKAKGDQAAVAWLRAVNANAGNRIYPDNETVTTNVDSGASAVSIENHYYWFRLAADKGASSLHSAIAFFAPGDPGFVRDVSGAAVLSSSKHQAAAQKFLAFLTSRAGETVLANSNSFEYPVGSATPASPKLTPLASLQPAPVTPADLGDGSLALQLEQKAGIL